MAETISKRERVRAALAGQEVDRVPIAFWGDWGRLPRLDPTSGWLAEHVESTRRVREALGPDVPIIQTLFSPITIAHKLSLGDSFGRYVRQHRDELHAGLALIARSSIDFARATLEAGADGFFYATQEATLDELTEPEFAELGKRYDLAVLRSMDDRAWFNL